MLGFQSSFASDGALFQFLRQRLKPTFTVRRTWVATAGLDFGR